jgi:SAM-dependent methyltransferase
MFHDLIVRHAAAARDVLELGPGPANETTRFLAGRFDGVDGLDVDPDASANSFLRRCAIYDGRRFPLADGSYDAVVADYVLEHVDDPHHMLAEIVRVLRPGGCFFFRTPNTRHFIPFITRITPHWFHRLVANPLRGLPAASHDPYPTRFRMNSGRTIRRLTSAVGLREVELRFVEREPAYGMAARPLFLLFTGYERVVNSTRLLEGFRINLFGAYRKDGPD